MWCSRIQTSFDGQDGSAASELLSGRRDSVVAVYHSATSRAPGTSERGAVPNVRRLAQYRPFENGGLDLRAVLSDLLLAAAAINDGNFSSILDCRQGFIDLWGIEVEVDELRPVLDALIKQGRMVRSGKVYHLTADALAVLRRRAREFDEIEARAFREWELLVRRMRPSVSDEDIELIRADLRDWLHEIILRHGAEATLMLYPEEERAREFFDAVDAHGFEQLPPRDAELSATEEALPVVHPAPNAGSATLPAGLLDRASSRRCSASTLTPSSSCNGGSERSPGSTWTPTSFTRFLAPPAPRRSTPAGGRS